MCPRAWTSICSAGLRRGAGRHPRLHRLHADRDLPRALLARRVRRRAGSASTAGRDGMLEFWIEADTFMRQMNRALVGTMLQVGERARVAGVVHGAARRAPRGRPRDRRRRRVACIWPASGTERNGCWCRAEEKLSRSAARGVRVHAPAKSWPGGVGDHVPACLGLPMKGEGAVDLTKVRRDDWILAGVALVLAIDLLVFPWFDISVGPFSATLRRDRHARRLHRVLALLCTIALIADLAVERFSPQTHLPAVGGSRETHPIRPRRGDRRADGAQVRPRTSTSACSAGASIWASCWWRALVFLCLQARRGEAFAMPSRMQGMGGAASRSHGRLRRAGSEPDGAGLGARPLISDPKPATGRARGELTDTLRRRIAGAVRAPAGRRRRRRPKRRRVRH